VAVLMEKIQGPQLWQGLGIQALWVILCLLAGRQLWLAGLRRYEAVGI
jgi:ABC-2 type transport system permease protein